MPAAPSEDLLTRKWGPMPVWAWAGLGLGGAYAVSRYRASKTASQQSTTPTTGSAAQPASGGPEYIIENNLPWQTPASSPVNVSVSGSPVVLPPSTGPQPPTTAPPPIQSGPVTTPGGPPATPPGSSPIQPPPAAPVASAPSSPIAHKVVSGDNLTKIAEEYGYGTNWQAIWNFNVGPSSPHSAAAKATLVKQGPNLIYAGQTIYIPPK